MSIYFYFAIAFWIWVFVFWISVILKHSRKKKLSDEKLRKLLKYFKKINIKTSYKEKIIDYDKLYHKTLLELWYKWTFWEILKGYPNEIHDIEQIWKLHKIRNKLVHDFDLYEESFLLKNAKEYKKELTIILK